MQIDSKLVMHLADVMLKDSRRTLSMRSLFRLCAIVLASLPMACVSSRGLVCRLLLLSCHCSSD